MKDNTPKPIKFPTSANLTDEEAARRLEERVAELRKRYEPKCGWLIDTIKEKGNV